MIDGKTVYSEEVIWEPRKHSDPDYHYREIIRLCRRRRRKCRGWMPSAAARPGSKSITGRWWPRSSATFHRRIIREIRGLFLRIRDEWKVPLEVINDGDVTALAGSMSLGDTGILGIALGSSEAAGYVDLNGKILGWVNEMAFAPVDYQPDAPVDEWSGDIGCGSQYFSQQCVFRLAPKAGIVIPQDITDAEKLAFVQERLAAGHEGAVRIWQTMGAYLGYGVAHYADFYDIKHVLILGRCTSGDGGKLILDGANDVLRKEFPELAARLRIQLPDEKSRRVGQSVAAASLPALSHSIGSNP